jgi:hypothetical protein
MFKDIFIFNTHPYFQNNTDSFQSIINMFNRYNLNKLSNMVVYQLLFQLINPKINYNK